MFTKGKLARRLLPAIGLTGALTVGLFGPANASSHREAPLSSEDPAADLTDVYAFVSPDNKDTLTIVANVNPFESPAGGLRRNASPTCPVPPVTNHFSAIAQAQPLALICTALHGFPPVLARKVPCHRGRDPRFEAFLRQDFARCVFQF